MSSRLLTENQVKQNRINTFYVMTGHKGNHLVPRTPFQCSFKNNNKKFFNSRDDFTFENNLLLRLSSEFTAKMALKLEPHSQSHVPAYLLVHN